jgi:hypothetical protein
MAQRIKGQEVEVLLLLNGEPVSSTTAIQSFSVEQQLEVLAEGYLGETTNRRDEVFNGVAGSMTLHMDDPDVFNVVQAIVDRATRREAGTIINIKAALAFPNGELKRVLVEDCFFGSIPMEFGSRTDYGTLNLDFEAAQLRYL